MKWLLSFLLTINWMANRSQCPCQPLFFHFSSFQWAVAAWRSTGDIDWPQPHSTSLYDTPTQWQQGRGELSPAILCQPRTMNFCVLINKKNLRLFSVLRQNSTKDFVLQIITFTDTPNLNSSKHSSVTWQKI